MLAATTVMAGPVARVCPLCGGPGRPRFRLRTYEIHTCTACRGEFNASFTGGGSDGELFGADYFAVRHKEAFEAQFADYRRDPSAALYIRRLGEITARVGSGSVLDVGPGLGTFLRLARDHGWHVEGVEISDFAARFIRRTHDIPVFTGDLTTFAAQTRRTFDVITFWDSLEHVGRPADVLRAARRLLRPGGLLVIATDNFDCLVADLGAALYRVSGGRVRYPIEKVFIDRNRTYFTEASLLALLKRFRLRVVRREKMEYPLSKVRANSVERVLLAALYGVAHVTGRQAQVTIFAVK